MLDMLEKCFLSSWIEKNCYLIQKATRHYIKDASSERKKIKKPEISKANEGKLKWVFPAHLLETNLAFLGIV